MKLKKLNYLKMFLPILLLFIIGTLVGCSKSTPTTTEISPPVKFATEYRSNYTKNIEKDVKELAKLLTNPDKYGGIISSKINNEVMTAKNINIKSIKLAKTDGNLAYVEARYEYSYDMFDVPRPYYEIMVLEEINNNWYILSDTSKFSEKKIITMKADIEDTRNKFIQSDDGGLFLQATIEFEDKYGKVLKDLDTKIEGKLQEKKDEIKQHEIIF